jgi:hypothetical protein
MIFASALAAANASIAADATITAAIERVAKRGPRPARDRRLRAAAPSNAVPPVFTHSPHC